MRLGVGPSPHIMYIQYLVSTHTLAETLLSKRLALSCPEAFDSAMIVARLIIHDRSGRFRLTRRVKEL